MEDLDLKKNRAEPPGSACPSMRSDWSNIKPPDFSTEPEPSDSEDQSQRRITELKISRSLLLMSSWSARNPPGFSTEPEPLDSEDQSQRRRAELKFFRFPLLMSPWSARNPPFFSTEPKPSDRKDQSQTLSGKLEELRRRHRLRAEQDVSRFPRLMSPWSARNPPFFSTEPEPPDWKDLIQRWRAEEEELRRQREQDELRRLRAKLEELRRQRAKLEELRRRRRQRAELKFSWFLPMMSPWSARKPPGFIIEPEPSDSEDQSQRLRAKLEELRRQIAEEEELLRCYRQIAEEEELLRRRRLRAKLKFSWFLRMMSPWSARNPPGFSTEPEPLDSEDLIQRLRAKLEELRRQREEEELRRRRRQRAKLKFSWFLPMMSPWSARNPPGFSTEPEPSDSEDLIQRLRAKQEKLRRRRAGWEEQEVFGLHGLSGLIRPSLGSNSSLEEPPDFSNKPEPSDRKDQIQRWRAELEFSWFLPMMIPCSGRKPPGFIIEPEPSDSEDQIQRLRAKQEELRRQIAEEEELLRRRRLRAKLKFSWFLRMMSPWSARNPPGFSTEPEPLDSEDLIQRRRAKLEELGILRAELKFFRFPLLMSPWSARNPPGFSTEPEPSDSEDLIQRLRAKQEKLRRRRAGWEEQEVFGLHGLSGLIRPSLGSNSSLEEPPDFSNKPEPSDRKDLIQRLRAKLEGLGILRAELKFSRFPCLMSPWSARKPPGFSTEPEPSDSEWK